MLTEMILRLPWGVVNGASYRHTDDPLTLLGRDSKLRLLLPRFAGVEYRGRGDISRLSPVL
jgi:hypothetical protein